MASDRDAPDERDDGTVDWRDDPDPDPPSLGPGAPEVDVPAVETSDSLLGGADSELARTFWRLVVVIDVGLLAVALGPMFVYFEGDWGRGMALFGFGVAVLVYGVIRYRRYHRKDSDSSSDGEPDRGAERAGRSRDDPNG